MRKLTTVAFSFSVAVLLAQYVIPKEWLLICVAFFALVALAGLFFSGNVRVRWMIIAFSVAAGLLWNFGYNGLVVSRAESLYGTNAYVTGVVTDFPTQGKFGYTVPMTLRTENGKIKSSLYVSGDSAAALVPGNVIGFDSEFSAADKIGDEDTTYYTNRGIFLLAKTSAISDFIDSENKILYFPKYLTRAITDKVAEIFPEHSSPFVKALLMGDTSDLSKDESFSSALSVTGTAHIVAVSGMHLSFLAGMLAIVLKNRKTAAIISIPSMFIFMAMLGFTPSVVRAGIMQMFIFIAPLLKRENDSITTLSAALLIILLLNPYSVKHVGLQLSFASTIGIMLFSKRIIIPLTNSVKDAKLYKKAVIKKMTDFVFSSFATTVGAIIFTTPLTALYFGVVSLSAPLVNILVLWAVTLVFCVSFFICILGFLWAPLGAIFAGIISVFVRYIILVIKLFSKIPFTAIFTSNVLISYWLFYVYIVFVLLVALKSRIRQFLISVFLAILSLCFVLVISAVSYDRTGMSLTALDIGQGQSLVINSGSMTAMIDCGSSNSISAGDVAANYILGMNRTKVDLLILTHFHADHANGVITLFDRLNVETLAIPDPDISESYLSEDIIEAARKKNVDIVYVTSNMTIPFGNAEFTLFAPIGSASENERCVSIMCTYNDFDILVTGDMDEKLERRLLRNESLPDIEVLIAGHHGSRYSTCEELLYAVTPEIAIISVGYNSYGHPTDDVLYRLTEHDIAIYRTDISGHVTVNAK